MSTPEEIDGISCLICGSDRVLVELRDAGRILKVRCKSRGCRKILAYSRRW